jgi:hypothetical protein
MKTNEWAEGMVQRFAWDREFQMEIARRLRDEGNVEDAAHYVKLARSYNWSVIEYRRLSR